MPILLSIESNQCFLIDTWNLLKIIKLLYNKLCIDGVKKSSVIENNLIPLFMSKVLMSWLRLIFSFSNFHHIFETFHMSRANNSTALLLSISPSINFDILKQQYLYHSLQLFCKNCDDETAKLNDLSKLLLGQNYSMVTQFQSLTDVLGVDFLRSVVF